MTASAVKPVVRPSFSRRKNQVRTPRSLRRPDLGDPPRIAQRQTFNAPIPVTPRFDRGFCQPLARPFGLVSLRPKSSNSRAEKPFTRCQQGRRSGHFGTLLGATGGDPNTLAPNSFKARQVRYARQALVRVPESNTKYGGWRGKTGVDHPPVIDASISESSGIPKRKKLSFGLSTSLGPAVHRRCIFCIRRIAFERLRQGYGDSWGSHARAPVVVAEKRGHGAAQFGIRRAP